MGVEVVVQILDRSQDCGQDHVLGPESWLGFRMWVVVGFETEVGVGIRFQDKGQA